MDTLREPEVAPLFESQGDKDTVRFITCGSVDDGKSTLLGRLLYESKAIFQDQLEALESELGRFGTQGENIDLALLVDGLQAEREQGITIDVAYRYLSTARRRFVVADTPGHEQYTRNMATGASTADVAIVLVDARKGILTQTRRHSRIVSMMGIRHVVLAVNKMDLVGYKEATFSAIANDYRTFAAELDFSDIQAIPLSALIGDNVVKTSMKMAWYSGPTLMTHLEMLEVGRDDEAAPLRLPVQWVNRANPRFRGFSGRLAGGQLHRGDRVRILPSGVETQIRKIIVGFDEVASAHAGDAVTVAFADDVDASRGDVIVAAEQPCEVADQFEACLLWMNEHPMVPGRQYHMKSACKEVTAAITSLKYRQDVNTGAGCAIPAG
jgi:bifunctional enzyme CysN/CysC